MKRRFKVALVVLGTALALVVFAWLLRDSIGTSAIRAQLEAHGFDCDERLAMTLSAGLREARLQPFACEAQEGHVAGFELNAPAVATLEWGSLRSLAVPSAQLSLRRPSAEDEPLGTDLLRRMNVYGRVGRLLQVLARAAQSSSLPSISVGELEVSRDGVLKAQVLGLSLTPGPRLGVGAQSVTFPAAGSSFASLELSDVSGAVDARAASFVGSADVRLGPIHAPRPWRFALDATQLDGEPQLELRRAE